MQPVVKVDVFVAATRDPAEPTRAEEHVSPDREVTSSKVFKSTEAAWRWSEPLYAERLLKPSDAGPSEQRGRINRSRTDVGLKHVAHKRFGPTWMWQYVVVEEHEPLGVDRPGQVVSNRSCAQLPGEHDGRLADIHGLGTGAINSDYDGNIRDIELSELRLQNLDEQAEQRGPRPNRGHQNGRGSSHESAPLALDAAATAVIHVSGKKRRSHALHIAAIPKVFIAGHIAIRALWIHNPPT